MADENKQVTLTFSGFDNTNDNTLMFEGPLYVAGTVNKISELYTWGGLQNFTSGDDVIVFVRNVNATSADSTTDKVFSGEIPYRGSFYRYMWDTQSWMQLVLGNHSHSNMEILDQLGEINTATMAVGDKKMLTVEKISNTDTGSGNLRKYEYKLSYVDLPEIPSVPSSSVGKKVYLTTDADGKFKWENSFAPAQTFKFAKVALSTTELTTAYTGNASGSKTFTLSKEYLAANNIMYNSELNDEVLVFDSGELVTDISTQFTNGNLIFTITNNKDTDKFELGETISFLFIRNGIAGLIDTIENQYITKSEAASLMSNGTINLNGYATKQYLVTNYAQINHAHKDYLRRDDYDAFDFRYSDYHHTHAEYITKADVLAILTDICDTEGNINIQNTISTLTTTLQNYVNNAIANTYTKTQINNLINTQIEAKNSTDSIVNSINGGTLTDYLNYLNNKTNSVTEVETDIVRLSLADKVNVGTGETIGGYKDGDVIEKGTNLSTIIHKLITREKVPTVVQPDLTVDYKVYNYDAGATSTVKIKPTFIKNNAGDLNKFTFKYYKSNALDANPISTLDITSNNGEEITLQLPMNAYNSDHDCYVLEFIAEYKIGPRILSNIMKEYTVQAGTISKRVVIKNKRLAYIGALTTDGTNTFNADSLYNLIYTDTTNNLLHEYNVESDDIQNGIRKVYEPDELARTIVIAIPNEADYELNKIMFENQNFDMLDDFTSVNLSLYDASRTTVNNINNNYKVYYYTFAKPVQSSISIKYCLNNKGE